MSSVKVLSLLILQHKNFSSSQTNPLVWIAQSRIKVVKDKGILKTVLQLTYHQCEFLMKLFDSSLAF